MAYSGFLLTGQGLRTFNSLSITEAFLGALTGFLLAIMFTLREGRRRRPAVVTYPVEQIFPNWANPEKTAAHIRSQSVDPNKQAEFGSVTTGVFYSYGSAANIERRVGLSGKALTRLGNKAGFRSCGN